jgi:hypothetical protein
MSLQWFESSLIHSRRSRNLATVFEPLMAYLCASVKQERALYRAPSGSFRRFQPEELPPSAARDNQLPVPIAICHRRPGCGNPRGVVGRRRKPPCASPRGPRYGGGRWGQGERRPWQAVVREYEQFEIEADVAARCVRLMNLDGDGIFAGNQLRGIEPANVPQMLLRRGHHSGRGCRARDHSRVHIVAE